MAKLVLPSSVEAEKVVLGSMLISENAASAGLARLSEESFSGVDPRNPLIFRAMVSCANNKQAIDITTVTAALENLRLMDQAGGMSYLLELLDSPISANNIDHYLAIVKDNATLRDYLKKLKEMLDLYMNNGTESPGQFMEKANKELREISERRSVGDFESSAEVAMQVNRRIEYISARANDKHLIGVDTGFTKLNEITHGWQKGDLIIIAARPSVGKTAFGMNLAFNAASLTGHPVAVFSLEMSNEQLMARLLSSVSWVSNNKISVGDLSQQDKLKIQSGLKQLSQTKLYFDDTPGAALGDILAKTRKLQNEHPDLALVVIDYLTQIKPEKVTNSTAEDIGTITGALKNLARSLNIPVICLAQLNRETEENNGGRPKLSNLKGSGSIEQDADIVLLMYRSDYFDDIGQKAVGQKGMAKEGTQTRMLQENAKAENARKGDNAISIVEIAVAKNRNGAIGKFSLMFNKDQSRFDNASTGYDERLAQARSGLRGDVSGMDD